jgi:hypothetical protein
LVCRCLLDAGGVIHPRAIAVLRTQAVRSTESAEDPRNNDR